MKHLFIPICIASFSFSATAFASQNNYYYVSGETGIFQANLKQSYLDQTDSIKQNIVQSVSQYGYTGGIAVGYRHSYSKEYFVGAELSENHDTQEASFQSGASTTAFSDKTNVNNHIDLTFVPGMNLTETISSYLKLGLSLASIHDNLTSPVGFLATSTAYHSHKNKLGFASGLGISKSITPNWSLFTEGNYHDYGTVSFKDFQNFSAKYSHTTHIYSYDVVVGLSYKFV